CLNRLVITSALTQQVQRETMAIQQESRSDIMMLLDNLKVAAKVALSSGSILALLLISAGISAWGLTAAQDNFTDYRALARETVAAGDVQAQLLSGRCSVEDFIVSGSEEAARQFDERTNAAEAALGAALELFTDS